MTISPEALEKARDAIEENIVMGDIDDDTAVITTGGMLGSIAAALQAERDAAAPKLPDDLAGLVERLNGVYRVPITDGLGAVGSGEEPDNPNEFVQRFETPPIQKEAAAAIQSLVARNAEPPVPSSTSGRGEISDLIEKLRLACDDPMWADHVEMPKKLLRHSVDYLSALKKQVEELTAERDAATISGWKAAIDCASYAAANTYGPRVDPAAVAKARDDLVQELLTASPGDYLDCCWKDAQDAIRAEAEAAALRKALREDWHGVVLDGRNEHGSHVLMLPHRSIELEQDENGDFIKYLAETILQDAERLGFSIGDAVVATFDACTDEGFFSHYEYTGVSSLLTEHLYGPPEEQQSARAALSAVKEV